MQQRLEQENAERYSATIVYGLLALLAGILAWAVWMGLRLRRHPPGTAGLGGRRGPAAACGGRPVPQAVAPRPVQVPPAPVPAATRHARACGACASPIQADAAVHGDVDR